ncbi:SWIM zinc finger family protein [Antrihabitans cavernicola]|uniref:SWIM zinc finger family protein n=1 Tax=Antrihabitans cavernicola TaxID=2495913 RepID=UPI001659A7AC|nr:hypothetical protein [Spelaeibacter cavernicola]
MTTAQGFSAFAPSRRGGTFARSWWGRAWIGAMEDTALDLGQLKKGRKLAKAGVVGPITVSPGLISATVEDGEQYSARLLVRRFDEGRWTQLETRIAERAAHLAALLDGDLPRDLAQTTADLGMDLIPTLGDIDSECGCDGWELPCRHAAAIAYQAAWLVDDDPFLVLLIRGRGRDDLLARLRDSVGAVDDSRTEAARQLGVPAAAVYARIPGPLPRLPAPEAFPDIGLPDTADAGVRAVHRLVESAARRARDMLQ